jgi:phosphomannomutase/phosphoglucomutase
MSQPGFTLNLMHVNREIFRAYDIRGIADTDLTDEVVEDLGKAYGTYIQQTGGPRIIVGRDARLSSERIFAAFVRGVVSTGATVFDGGLITTPMMYFAIWQWQLDGGINVTGSHNPKEYNGFKVCRKQAFPIYGEELLRLYDLVQSGGFTEGVGSVEQLDVWGPYKQHVLKLFPNHFTYKIVIDSGNGIAGPYAPEVFRALGCKVIALDEKPDGNFPNHTPDPSEPKNMVDLQQRVIAEKADLGIGIDGDGDRIGIIDNKGSFQSTDKTMVVLSRDMLERHPHATVLCDIKCSSVTVDDINQHGGKGELMPTGRSYFNARMAKDPSVWLGGEEAGHIYIREDWFGFDDAIFVGLKILQAMQRKQCQYVDFLRNLPPSLITPEIRLHCSDHEKFRIVSELTKLFALEYNVITMDGARINFSPTSWGLVRASNTNPYLSLRFEAQDALEMSRIQKLVDEKLQHFPEITDRLISA